MFAVLVVQSAMAAEESRGIKSRSKQVKFTGERWALLIGINGYATMSELNYCAQDARAIQDVLIRRGGYDPQKIILLTEDQEKPSHHPTFANVKRRIAQITREAGPDDSLIISFSGHGTVVNDRGYLIPLDGDEDLAISMLEIRRQIEACEARQKVLILDTCHSGKDRSSVRAPSKLLDEAAGKGFITITSCDADEKAYEDDAAQSGIFTKHLVEGLSGMADGNKDGDITHAELYEYTYEQVRSWSIQSGKKQHPKLIGEQVGKLVLARAPAGKFLPDIPFDERRSVITTPTTPVKTPQTQPKVTPGPGQPVITGIFNQGSLEDRVIALIKNGMFEEAAKLLDDRTDKPWKVAISHMDNFAVCWNDLMKAPRRSTVHIIRVRNALNVLAMDYCLWYDEAAPWYGPCHNALEKMTRTMTDWLDSNTGEDDWNVFLMLALQWRDLNRLLTRQTEVDIIDIQGSRIRREGASHQKTRPWMESLTPLSDPMSGLPMKIALKTPHSALRKMSFIYIPPGKSVVGPIGPNEEERTVVELSGYYMAEHEISNDIYLKFCKEWETAYPEHMERRSNPFSHLEQPVVSVSYNEASHFCRWLQDVLSELDDKVICRLPTESEIDRSARGPSLFRYTWGYKYDPKSCFNAITSPLISRKIGDASSDISFYGVVNLAGNVSEWIQDSWSLALSQSVPDGSKDPSYKTDDLFKTIKGANYTSGEEAEMRTARRQASGGEQQERTVGFRVVLSFNTASGR